MKVEILGTGCPSCQKLEANVREALKELSLIEAEVIKVTDLQEIMGYGVMVTPALVVDGEVVVYGRVPTVDEIKEFLVK